MDQRERLRVRGETMWLKTVKKRGRLTEQMLGRNFSSPTVLRGPTYVCEDTNQSWGKAPGKMREHTTYMKG